MRSDLLLHWTGKSFHQGSDCDSQNQSRSYVDRLADIVKHGFWMTMPTEILRHGNERGGSSSFAYKAPMTCFTELKLSESQSHADAFGRLGVAVNRDFVLERWGGPVHYVRNHGNEFLVSNHLFLQRWVSAVPEETPQVGIARDIVPVLLGFLKGMSTPGIDDFTHLEEHEWRIVHTHNMVEKGLIEKSNSSPPSFRIPLRIQDIRMVIFPDGATRDLALQEKKLAPLHCARDIPLLTLGECVHL